MKRLADVIGLPLEWVQPKALRELYELRSGSDLVATLTFRSAFGSLATAETADACWTFKRVGFWKTHVTVRRCDSAEDLAIFHHNTWRGGGALELADGRVFLATTNFWQTRFEIQQAEGETLLRFHLRGILHQSAGVELLITPADLPELSLLINLGWYLAVMMSQDSAVVATATV